MRCDRWLHRLWYAHDRRANTEFWTWHCVPRLHVGWLRTYVVFVPHDEQVLVTTVQGSVREVEQMFTDLGPSCTYAEIEMYLVTSPHCREVNDGNHG